MEQLALVFAKMNLHDDNLSPIQEVSSQIKPALTFATIPLPAPIPANIRTFPPPTSILRTPSKAGSTIKTMFGEEEGSIMHSFTPSSSRMLLIRTSTRESTSSSTIPPSSSIYATSLRSVLNSLPSSNSLFSSPSLPPIELPSDPAKLPFPGYVTPLSRSCGSTRLDSLFTSNSIPIGALRTAFV